MSYINTVQKDYAHCVYALRVYLCIPHMHNNMLLSLNPFLLPPDEAQRTEADQMLRTILEVGEKCLDSAHTATVAHCLAMLWFLGGDSQKVRHLTRSGQQPYTLPTFPPTCASHGVPSRNGISSNW